MILESGSEGQGIRDVDLTCTTLTTKTRERGSVKMMRTREKTVRAMAHTPGPSSHPAHTGHSLDTGHPFSWLTEGVLAVTIVVVRLQRRPASHRCLSSLYPLSSA